uniref:G-protein coupled receptors family 1 profile domain-containing protein n=1 Tax=Felis catus TaxID=9685 RepID=A0ABI7VXN5_FELCA
MSLANKYLLPFNRLPFSFVDCCFCCAAAFYFDEVPIVYFCFCSISFINVLLFSEYRSFTSLVKFNPRYFIVFGAIVNGIVFLISLSAASLLVYRNTTHFCRLFIYPATLLNSCISSGSFFMESLGFSLYSIMSSSNSESFSFFLTSLDAFHFVV